MEGLIKKILRNYKKKQFEGPAILSNFQFLNTAYKFMDFEVDGSNWYALPQDVALEIHKLRDTIILINPITRDWFFEIESGKDLWVNKDFTKKFMSFFKIEKPEYQEFLKFWIKDNTGIDIKNILHHNSVSTYITDKFLEHGIIVQTIQ